MAKITNPLSDTQVKSAKPKDKAYKLYDGNGLTLRIKPSGAKSWVFEYAIPHTKKRTSLGFGVYPEVSLANARIKKRDAKELLARDIDPKADREIISNKAKLGLENTLLAVSRNWFKVKRTTVSDDYAIDVWRSLELYIIPKLGNKPISELSAPEVIEQLKPIAAKGSLETVKRLTQRLNEIMTFAVNTGVIFANPLAGIKSAFQNPVKKHYPTLLPEQLPELMKAISYASIKKTTRYLIEWQLHTMIRPSEAAGTRWAEIDLDAKLWSIPAERMKKKKAHTVPLSTQAISLLEALHSFNGGNEFVFTADRNRSKSTNPSTANVALKRMGFDGRLVAHGMRSLASTTLNEQGFDSDVIESALAHTDKNEVRGAYNRAEYLERRRVMMQSWSNCIEDASNGKAPNLGQHKALRVVSNA